MYNVLLKTSAKKALDTLPVKARNKIALAIDELSRLGIHARHVKKLQPPVGGFRQRVGEYRILFDRNEELIVVHHISKRADAY
jgi:mRNA interferase RelE/StbE